MPSRVWDEVKDFFRRLTDVKVGPIGVRVEPRDQSRDRDISEPTIEPEEEEPRRIRLQQLDVDVLSELAQRDNDEEETELEDLVDALDLGRLECEYVLHRLCDAGFLECLEDGTLRLTREGVEYAVRRRLFQKGMAAECLEQILGLEFGEFSADNIDTYRLAGDGARVAFGTREGSVFLSEDGGETWNGVASGLPAVECVAILS